MKALRVLSLIGLLAFTTVPLFVQQHLFGNRSSVLANSDPLPPPDPWKPAASLLMAS
jgi:hypothetical protein